MYPPSYFCLLVILNAFLVGVLGSGDSTVTSAVSRILHDLNVPQITFGASNNDLSDKTKYRSLLRTEPSDKQNTKVHIRFRLLVYLVVIS